LDVPNHFIKRESENEILVKKMQMLPIECVVRGYFYGSLISRWKKGEVKVPDGTDTTMAAKLPEPIFDPTTKSEHDIPIDKQKALEMKLVTEEQYNWLEKTSIEIYKKMASIADNVGFILADLKLEFGLLDGKITLGDSIGPDEYRLWPKDSFEVGKIQEAYDKQLLRDWLTANGFQKQFDDARDDGQEPVAPQIPEEIISKMTNRYVTAYEKLSGRPL
jgi:phosphoribosylaminoimidazole-succinocarboxamide synthase